MWEARDGDFAHFPCALNSRQSGLASAPTVSGSRSGLKKRPRLALKVRALLAVWVAREPPIHNMAELTSDDRSLAS